MEPNTLAEAPPPDPSAPPDRLTLAFMVALSGCAAALLLSGLSLLTGIPRAPLAAPINLHLYAATFFAVLLISYLWFRTRLRGRFPRSPFVILLLLACAGAGGTGWAVWNGVANDPARRLVATLHPAIGAGVVVLIAIHSMFHAMGHRTLPERRAPLRRAGLRALAASGGAAALCAVWLTGPLPQGLRAAVSERGSDDCLRCHAKSKPGLVAQWAGSSHGRVGVSCGDCHGSDHVAMLAAGGAVAASACARCHAPQVAEFARSLHAIGEAQAISSARFKAQPEAMQRAGCLACHDIGRRWSDGSVGRCDRCHGGHRFEADDARRPEACGICHMGPDHPQIEAWRASPHGVAWSASGPDERTAPTCSTCHMPDGTHDGSGLLTLGTVSNGAALEGEPRPISMRILPRAAAREARERMVSICARCHSPLMARASLRDADEVKRAADGLLAEGAQVIRAMHTDGLLDPMPEVRAPNPVEGRTLVLGGNQLYEGTTPVEQRFFEMYKYHHVNAFKGAYHQSPDYTHWYGNARMKTALVDIWGEYRRAREAAALRKAIAPEGAR